ncbi:hypothetical protein D3C72_1122220 [compost metagenome]
MREFRVAHRHQPEPRHGDGEQHRGAGQHMEPAPQTKIARGEGIDHQHQPGQRQPDQPLDQHRHAHGGPARQHPAAARCGRGLRVLREQHAGQHARHRAGQGHVQRIEMSGDIPHRRRQQRQPGQQRHALPIPPRRGQHGHAQAKQAGQRHAQARLPVADAEQRIGQRGHPQVEGRFLEVLELVVADRHPVAGDKHLARDFRVAALVGAQQVAHVERAEPDQQDGEADQHDSTGGGGTNGQPGIPRGR